MEQQYRMAKRLEGLYDGMLRMGSLVEEALRKALIALSNWDEELAGEVIEEDARIDSTQIELEDECTDVIARMQPVGSDLREIVCCIKTLTDLERIGDHARHVARSLTKSAGPHYSTMLPRVRQLGNKVLAMVHDSLTALVDRDAEKAREVAHRDTEDALTVMKTEAQGIEAGQQIILLSRYLERIGDHVTNISASSSTCIVTMPPKQHNAASITPTSLYRVSLTQAVSWANAV